MLLLWQAAGFITMAAMTAAMMVSMPSMWGKTRTSPMRKSIMGKEREPGKRFLTR